jgi:putative methyltransferase (TIGR04325 family)
MRPSHFIAALDDVSVSNTSALPRMVKDWLPPALWLLLRRLRYGDDALYEYVGPEWPKEIGAATGWDEPFAIEIMEANWERYRAMAEGTARWDRRPWNTSISDQFAANDMSSFALSLALSARGRDRVSVLDWGGAFGHYALIARTLLPHVDIDYTVKERRAMCAAGTRLNPRVSFTSDDDAALSRRYDLVVAAGALQYSQNWSDVATKLAESATNWLLFTQLPITDPWHPSFVVAQRLRRSGVAGDSTCWIFDKREFIHHLRGCGLTLLREFLSAGPRRVKRGPANSISTALLFRR